MPVESDQVHINFISELPTGGQAGGPTVMFSSFMRNQCVSGSIDLSRPLTTSRCQSGLKIGDTVNTRPGPPVGGLAGFQDCSRHVAKAPTTTTMVTLLLQAHPNSG